LGHKRARQVKGGFMIEKYHEPIFKLISEKGALGVNQIAKETEIPLSTVQKYLSTQQSYFRKNEDRKWDLPEKVTSDISDSSLTLAVEVMENSIQLFKAQLEEMVQAAANVLTPINTIKRGISNKPAPVADKQPRVQNPKLAAILENVGRMPNLIKSKKSDLTDNYYQLLMNTDWLSMQLDLGDNYMKEVIVPGLSDLLLNQTEKLDEDTYTAIKDYQINDMDI
jgi:hypothetical protein